MGFLDHDENSNEYELSDCYIFVTTTLIMQANIVIPKANSNRIAFSAVLLAAMVIFYYWEAMLISYLAVRKTQLPFSTLDELAENSNYKVNSIC